MLCATCREALLVAHEAARTSERQPLSLPLPPPPHTVEDIDTHIAELEHRISHDSLSLNEEKRVLEQIKALRKSRATIGELTSKVSQLEADSSAVDGLRDGIKGLDDAIDKVAVAVVGGAGPELAAGQA